MMNWKENAIKILTDSLIPVPQELNELDWKSGLSCKTDRLAQHISAFANQKGGGLLVYGVNDDGTCFSVSNEEVRKTVQLLGNIAKNNLSYSVIIEHAVMDYNGYSLLFIYIPEQIDKPVYLRGKDIFDSYIRSAGQTVRMSRNQVKFLLAESAGRCFEDRIAKDDVSQDELLQILSYQTLYDLLEKDIPASNDAIVNKLFEFGFCLKNKNGNWDITNLGALLLANHATDFDNLKNRTVIVRKYTGANNLNLAFEQIGGVGYAVGFKGLIDFIVNNTSTETIDVIRKGVPMYPRVAIREFVANALVHQDFAITGMPITIEIFSNRLVITNPGTSLNDVNRLIDLPPHSRNEKLAQTLFLLGICERRGSGVDRAVESIEKMFLPAVKIVNGNNFTKVTLFPKKKIKEMTKQEKIIACYQHACLVYESSGAISNQSVRERFNLDKNKSAIASRIIADTLEAGLIKLSDASITSKKYASYIPYYG